MSILTDPSEELPVSKYDGKVRPVTSEYQNDRDPDDKYMSLRQLKDDIEELAYAALKDRSESSKLTVTDNSKN